MDKRRNFAGLILLLVAVLTACSQGDRKEKTLDRQTAYEIVKENFKSTDGARKWKFPLIFRDSFTPAAGKGAGGYSQLGARSVEFRNQLVAAGLLEKPHEVRKTDKAFLYDVTNISLSYQVVPQEFVRVHGDVAEFVLETVSIQEVTGIRQEGSEAVVEVALKHTPTPVYKRLWAAFIATKPNVPVFEFSPDGGGPLPSPQQLERSETVTYAFVRYDDGWRIE